MPLPNLKSLFTGGASNLVDSVKGVISEFHLSPEDKLKAEQELTKITNDHIEKMASLAQAELEVTMKDMDSARDREIQIAVADKAPLINKIVTPVLALTIVGLVFFLFYVILFKGMSGVEKDILVYVLGALTTFIGQILSYYFGSSQSSANKQKQISDLMNK